MFGECFIASRTVEVLGMDGRDKLLPLAATPHGLAFSEEVIRVRVSRVSWLMEFLLLYPAQPISSAMVGRMIQSLRDVSWRGEKPEALVLAKGRGCVNHHART
jgi:hypothetical protein